ncbi:hypothetical protein ABZ234_06340 [Nocardiopsis sp. NPDC006198]|uniref:hypothetical protein n=1 Tax=Nocardiopsis sp. NPDC006198 TaxID=3154472 RepID=UPI0033A25021
MVDSPPDVRVRRREGDEQNWYTAVGFDERTRRAHLASPTPEMLRYAVEVGRGDLVEYLARHPRTARRVGELGGLLATKAFAEIRGEAGRRSAQHPDMARIAAVLPGHFWCSLLAVLVGVADRVDQVVDKVPAQARDLLEEEPPPEWGTVQELVADTALEAVWECATGLFALWHPAQLFLVMRVLAVFICPAPARHPDVARLCLLPLGRGILQDAATRMLQQSLGPV